ncbi:MAG: UvrD-helicase domain-containing protein [Bacteroidia bacterium]
MDFLSELNEPQQQAVLQSEGPVMIIAGAGSGKTRVLTYRIAYMMQKGADAFSILALTFTNKAAREMKNRIERLVGTEARNLYMGTFHSVFARVLRVEAAKIGYPSNFTIYDTDDSKSLMRDIIKEQGLDDKIYKPSLVLHRISSAKNNLFNWQHYQDNIDLVNEDTQSGKPKLGLLFELYSKRCFKAGAMDFDDLLFNTHDLLIRFPDVLHKYQNRFKYVLVDEFQDTNWAQYKIVRKLAAQHENICVVGDDAQSIYAFRGANIQNILSFEKDYPDLKKFKLEQNYRSTQNIVNAANSVIAKNRNQLKKLVWTDNDEGDKIKLMRAMSDNEEGSLVANTIFEDRMQAQLKNSDFAILYRTNAQSRSMEEALRRLGIPYRIYGGLSFYARKEIKDLLSYLRLTINHNDEEALKRIINYPKREIGKTSLDRLIVAADKHEKPLWEIVENVNMYCQDINAPTRLRILDFAAMIKSFAVIAKTKNAYDAASYIANQSGLLKDLYADRTPEGISHFENLQELLNGIKEFSDTGIGAVPAPGFAFEEDVDDEDSSLRGTKQSINGDNDLDFNGQLNFAEQEISNHEQEAINPELENTNHKPQTTNQIRTIDQYMQDIALLTDADKKTDDGDNDKVSLMTIHAAKGLEFKNVFVVGLEENLFPSMMAMQSRADLEEERRLFYVAITRAEKKLYLTYAISRYRYGNLQGCEPSRFIEEVAEQYLEIAFKQHKAKPDDYEDTWQPDFGRSSFNLKAPSRPTNREAVKPSSNPQPKLPSNFKKISSANASTNAGHTVPIAIGRSRSAENDFIGDDPNLITTGMEVEHARFGKGKVISMEGKFPDTKCTIFFAGEGQKQLLLKYAKLKIVG